MRLNDHETCIPSKDFQIPVEKTVATTVQSKFNNNTRSLPKWLFQTQIHLLFLYRPRTDSRRRMNEVNLLRVNRGRPSTTWGYRNRSTGIAATGPGHRCMQRPPTGSVGLPCQVEIPTQKVLMAFLSSFEREILFDSSVKSLQYFRSENISTETLFIVLL